MAFYPKYTILSIFWSCDIICVSFSTCISYLIRICVSSDQCSNGNMKKSKTAAAAMLNFGPREFLDSLLYPRGKVEPSFLIFALVVTLSTEI